VLEIRHTQDKSVCVGCDLKDGWNLFSAQNRSQKASNHVLINNKLENLSQMTQQDINKKLARICEMTFS
jgi:hypothetical protein